MILSLMSMVKSLLLDEFNSDSKSTFIV